MKIAAVSLHAATSQCSWAHAGPDLTNPAPGYRHHVDGALYGIGSGGYSWASAVNGSDGLHLGFYMTWLIPSGAYYRVYGFQLRCLSE